MVSKASVSWQSATVVVAEDAASGVRRIVVEPDSPRPALPGTHLDVELPDNDRVVRRSYSVVSSGDGGRAWTLGVRLSPSSRGGSRAMHSLGVGDRLRVTDPLQNFPLGVGAGRYVLLAGGIGITAVHAMADALKRRGADYRFLYVGRSQESMPWVEELAAAHEDRITIHVDEDGTSLDVAASVAEIAAHPLSAETELYMCGPIRLMDAVRRAWAQHGLPAANLRFETFGNSGAWAAEEFIIRIEPDDVEVAVPVELSALEALEAAGVEVMADCRKGECGLCTVRILGHSGLIDHRDVFLDDEQKASDTRLCLCVSRATGNHQETPGATAVLVIDRP